MADRVERVGVAVAEARRPLQDHGDVLPVPLVVVDPLVERKVEPVLDRKQAARAIDPEEVRVLRRGKARAGRIVAVSDQRAPSPPPGAGAVATGRAVVARPVDPVLDEVVAPVAHRQVGPARVVQRAAGARDGLRQRPAVRPDRARHQAGAVAPAVADRHRPGSVHVGQRHRRVEAAGQPGAGRAALLGRGQRRRQRRQRRIASRGRAFRTRRAQQHHGRGQRHQPGAPPGTRGRASSARVQASTSIIELRNSGVSRTCRIGAATHHA